MHAALQWLIGSCCGEYHAVNTCSCTDSVVELPIIKGFVYTVNCYSKQQVQLLLLNS